MTIMNTDELRDILEFAVESAREAGRLTLGYFNVGTPHELKPDNSPVTIADRKSEELLRKRIERAFPKHGILGEEFGETVGSEPGRWIVDPIDGTFSFICGVPTYSVLIGFEWAGEMLAGVIYLPALDEIVYAARGLGCRWNDGPARVSQVSELSQARVSITSLKTTIRRGRYEAYRRLLDAVADDRGWPDSYAYALLATGRVDIVADPIMNIWDTAALLPIVTEAGGRLTDWNGTATHTAPEALATNGLLHEAALATLRGDERA